MKFTSRELFTILKENLSEEEIFKGAEFSKERFMKNLEKEESGDVDQLVIKQFHLLLGMVPVEKFVVRAKHDVLNSCQICSDSRIA